eukprot:CAMPEP_0202688930 /NCGR_PEP_ID=MMETSP1385-20130828/4309_1 /ASSEMBLY_ACC=CAM_ASM_000861 /TAXON_ID=933848 /ORGANISM="Elphidium margaritaceum" /LENGTH=494 /DNA_ID=CAMNT_0049343989 /DNA_START=82 /DNA_END=1566 /DNA_ORIENTATION=+
MNQNMVGDNSKASSHSAAVAHQPHLKLHMEHRLHSREVLSSKTLSTHILSYMPIDSLRACALVKHDWYLILTYIVPISLCKLRMLCMGELLYWLPGENQFPKTVLLKLRFSSGVPAFIQIVTAVNKHHRSPPQSKVAHKNGYHTASHQNGAQNYREVHRGNELVAGHYQMIELSEILFVIDGHWTPVFEQLNECSAQQSFDQHESQFFHRSRCFSIVTNTYMTYDFIAFNADTNFSIVHILRSIIQQTHERASKMAIYAKANRKYNDALGLQPLVFTDTVSALEFEMFVLVLQDCIHKVGAQLDIDIPSVITTDSNASLLFPLVVEDGIAFSDWHDWCRYYLLDTLRSHGYIEHIDDNINADNEYGILHDHTTDTSTSEQQAQNDDDKSQHGGDDSAVTTRSSRVGSGDSSDRHSQQIQVLYKQNRRQSSLFGRKAFLIDENVDLFAGVADSDNEHGVDDYDGVLREVSETHSHHTNSQQPNSVASNDPNCIVM